MKTSSRFLALVLGSSMLLTLGCGGAGGGSTPEDDVVRSDKHRITTPQVLQSDLQLQVEGNNDFSWRLYQKLRSEPGNLFFSPHSITTALAMAYAGAGGNTEQQMAQALDYRLAQSDLHAAFNKLDLELNSRGQNSKAADGNAFRLNVINAIWGQRDFAFERPFLDTIALNYGAGLRLLDFMHQSDASRQRINQWVEDNTEGKIKELLQPGTITDMTRLVLTNAIYFNAAWAEPFPEESTSDAPFTLLDNSQVTVPMMNKSDYLPYAGGQGYAAVALPYDGNELSMLVIVPDAGTFDSFEASLTGAKVQQIVDSLQETSVTVELPRFKAESEFSLKGVLAKLGMSDAFTGAADFSGITSAAKLSISDVIHKAFVSIHESGTEAAAATAVVMAGSGLPPKTLIANRPYIFLVRDHATGATLFVGRVLNP